MDKQKITLEEYKQQVAGYLKSNFHYSETAVLRAMKPYTEDFPMFYEENWKPEDAATAINLGY